MNTSTLGPVQAKIITCLRVQKGWVTPTDIVRYVYGLKTDEPTLSQRVSIRRALRTLERNDIVRMTKHLWNRERVWELTGKIVPAPEKKKAPPRKPLAVVK